MAKHGAEGTYIERVTSFLSEYLEIPKKMLWPDGNIAESAIPICVKVIMNSYVFTEQEMREQALKDYAVILPLSYFE